MLMGWQDQGLAFDVAVHVGSLIAVLAYFRRDVWSVTGGTFSWARGGGMNPEARLGLLVVLGTIPAGLAGLLFKDWIEVYLRSPLVIAATTIGFGLLLWWADRQRGERDTGDMRWMDGLWIGLAQALALIPGTSRSGITITAGLFLGLSREAASRFSFLLAIPITALAAGVKILEVAVADIAVDWTGFLIGGVTSFVMAITAIHFFLKWLNKVGMWPYVVYRVILAGVIFAVLM